VTVLNSVIVEQFEQGAWIADVSDVDPLDGTFELAGETWRGTVIDQANENGFYVGRVIGGAGKLSESVRDRYYDSRVTLREVVNGILSPVGETIGTVDSATVTTYMRLRGTVGAALETLARTYGVQWWVARDGRVNVGVRPSGPDAQGVRVDSGPDGSVYLRNPENVDIGGTYDGQTIKHVRWTQTADVFECVLYFRAFADEPLTDALDYRTLHSALVHAQNADGTLDLVVGGRYTITNVQYLSGIPDSKIVVAAGDPVVLGFYNGDPRAPFAVATWQNAAATQGVARVNDTVAVGTISAQDSLGGPVTITYTPPGGAPTAVIGPAPTTLQGVITSGSSKVLLGGS
jgi:hypothetical protein